MEKEQLWFSWSPAKKQTGLWNDSAHERVYYFVVESHFLFFIMWWSQLVSVNISPDMTFATDWAQSTN